MGVFLLLGAGVPSASKLGVDTLAGEATAAARADADDSKGRECPGFSGVTDELFPGDRQAWSATIAANDPNTQLRVRPCVEPTLSAAGTEVLRTGPFTLTTDRGKVRGQIQGFIDNDADGFASKSFFSMELIISNGSGSYSRASGSLWYTGCIDYGPTFSLEDDRLFGASITTTRPNAPACAGRTFG